jgi:hypothetical protein
MYGAARATCFCVMLSAESPPAVVSMKILAEAGSERSAGCLRHKFLRRTCSCTSTHTGTGVSEEVHYSLGRRRDRSRLLLDALE